MTLRLAVTPGEPSGIGPDILLQYIQRGCAHQLVAFADPDMLGERAEQLGLPLQMQQFDPDAPATPLPAFHLSVSPIATGVKTVPGKLNSDNATYVLNCLDTALEACQSQHCDGLVTGPVQKSVINDAGIVFSGHTEYLAEKTGTPTVVMMLATETMRVALATTHIPLREVADAINQPSLERIIEILNRDLRTKFAIANPKILICGLNPHAGEGGHLGREEIEVISPVINNFQNSGLDVAGPFPADTVFTAKYLENADAILAMYHDQGLPVLKHAGFGNAANITLGLPIIRTSVDHGTALDLAATGSADQSSFNTAVKVAAQMATLSKDGLD
jgi:4-hydroxythreonine-4-phosphate dehydrogenase